jgi:BirA family biotin operon repressor/biotin-[acetyl-CoA-carboxylase] ligase
MSEGPVFPVRAVWHTGNRHIGREVVVLESADSTNTRALLDGREGIAYLADEQTAGRGQHGRTWVAGPRSSVLLSVVLPVGQASLPATHSRRPHPPAHALGGPCASAGKDACPTESTRPAVLTAWAAVCVCEVARRFTGIQARIKWPNDVLLKGRKVAGILIERSGAGPFVAGIGLNVRQTAEEFHQAGLPQATSLRAMGADVQTDEVARMLLAVLDEEMGRLLSEGPGQLEALWRWHLGLLGRNALSEGAAGVVEGRILDIGFDSVVIETNGQAVTLAPEGITGLTAVTDKDG